MKKLLADKKLLIAAILVAITALLGIILGSVALGEKHWGMTVIDVKDAFGSNVTSEVDLAYFGGIFTLVFAIIGSIVLGLMIFMTISGKMKLDSIIILVIAIVLLVLVFSLGIAAATAV